MGLVSVLADLYPDPGSQRRMADQLGIGHLVDIGGAPIDAWAGIVRAARTKSQIGALIVAALTDYGSNGNLQAAIDEEWNNRSSYPMPHNDYDDSDRSERRADQTLIMNVLTRLERRIESVQEENVKRRHAQDNVLQSLVSQVAVLVSKEQGRERREESMQEGLSRLDSRMGAVEGALRSLTAEGRAEAHIGSLDIKHAVWLALGFVAALGIMLIAAQYVVGNL